MSTPARGAALGRGGSAGAGGVGQVPAGAGGINAAVHVVLAAVTFSVTTGLVERLVRTWSTRHAGRAPLES